MNVVLIVKLPSSFVADLKEIKVFVKTDVFYFSVLFELDKSNERGLRRHLIECFLSKSNLKVKSKLCSFTNCSEGGYKHIIMMSNIIIHERTTQCWM